MSPQGTSSLAPNKTVGRCTKCNITPSQKRLQHLTKVAVDRAYKLHAESRRLVHIVETQTCGNSTKRLGCSIPFSSLSSALFKNSSSTTPSSSKTWALPKNSNDRSSVAARIHTLVNQWRPDSSSAWRARVASVVPVLEEVVYKEAKSQEEYTNPQLLQSQLMNVLCHFEAGNGPFLLQGSSPLYPVRACNPPSSSSHRLSPLCQHALPQGVSANEDSHETIAEETCESVGLTSTQSSASAGSSPILTRWEANDTFQNICSRKVSTNKHGGSHASSKIVKKVASMLSKKRREKQELERADQGAETVERFITNAEIEAVGRVESNTDGMPCHRSPVNSYCGNERRRSTLGGILKLDMFSTESPSLINADAAPRVSSTAEGTLLFHAEEVPLSLSTPDKTSHNIISNSGAEASDPGYILDSQTAEAPRLSYSHSSLIEVVHPEEERGANRKCKAVSSPFPSSTSASTPSPPSSSSSASSSLSLSSSSAAPCRSMPSSPSSSSTSAPSPSLPHQASLSLPSPPSSSASASSSSSSSSPPCRSMPSSPSSSSASAPSPSLPHQAPLSLPLPLFSLPSSTPQEHFITCLKPSPQHQSTSLSQQLGTLRASSDVPSMELNNIRLLMCEDHQNAALNDNSRANVLLQAKEAAAKIASEQSITQTTTPEELGKIEKGESASTSSPSTSSTTSSPSPAASNEESRERKVKLPLRSFLAEREEYMGRISSYKKGGPWETWEEAT